VRERHDDRLAGSRCDRRILMRHGLRSAGRRLTVVNRTIRRRTCALVLSLCNSGSVTLKM
jgi:hypothetical protein